jgi:hypothetical protein
VKPWDFSNQATKPRRGERNFLQLIFCRPCWGFDFLTIEPTVKPWATFLRASGAGCGNLTSEI